MTSRVGEKFATIAERYGMVENQDSELRLDETRADETKRGFPSDGSDSWPVASAAIALRYAE